MNNKFRDWILKTYKRPIYEYEHHGYFTIEDMEEAWEEGANEIAKIAEKDIDKDIAFDRYFSLEKDGWYFWNETWSDLIGPFEFKSSAVLHFMKYCDILNKENLESMKEK